MKISQNPILKYFQSSFSELKKVTWLTRQEVINLTLMVIISVGVATALVMGTDYLLTKAVNYLIQK